MPAKGRSAPDSGGEGAGRPGNAALRRCPICGKPASEANKPFCSPRCRDVDLNRWLSGSYTIPGRPLGDEDEE
jgi:uncharacterized protein